MTSLRLFGAALTLPGALAVTLVLADSPRFAPVEKSSVVKTIALDMKMESVSMTITLDGEPLPEQQVGKMSMAMSEHQKLVITDRYVKVAGGRPTELDRTFDELASNSSEEVQMPGSKGEPKEKTEVSDLEGKTVRFSWKDEAYEKSFAGDGGDKALLEDLEEDLDFRMLLPAGEVKVDDTWKLGSPAFKVMLSAGGDLHFHEEGKEEEEKKETDVGDQFDENLAGKGTGTFESIREKDGLRLAVIKIEAELTTHAKDAENGLDMKLKLDVEGEMLWDLAANRVHAVELTGAMKLGMTGDQDLGESGQAHTLHMDFQLEGEMRLEVETQVP